MVNFFCSFCGYERPPILGDRLWPDPGSRALIDKPADAFYGSIPWGASAKDVTTPNPSSHDALNTLF